MLRRVSAHAQEARRIILVGGGQQLPAFRQEEGVVQTVPAASEPTVSGPHSFTNRTVALAGPNGTALKARLGSARHTCPDTYV